MHRHSLHKLFLATASVTVLAAVMDPGTPVAAQVVRVPTVSVVEPVDCIDCYVPEGWNEEERYMLLKIAMAEAEGEDTAGKALVMCVVLNRVESIQFPDTIRDVVFDDGEFTSVQNGRYDRVEPDKDCYAALEMVKAGWDGSDGALYFERTTDDSTWHSRNLSRMFAHGNHTFYMEKEEQ